MFKSQAKKRPGQGSSQAGSKKQRTSQQAHKQKQVVKEDDEDDDEEGEEEGEEDWDAADAFQLNEGGAKGAEGAVAAGEEGVDDEGEAEEDEGEEEAAPAAPLSRTEWKDEVDKRGRHIHKKVIVVLMQCQLETVKTKKGFELVCADTHHGILKKFNKNPENYRPDITHQVGAAAFHL
jgi:hypothetical protein